MTILYRHQLRLALSGGPLASPMLVDAMRREWGRHAKRIIHSIVHQEWERAMGRAAKVPVQHRRRRLDEEFREACGLPGLAVRTK